MKKSVLIIIMLLCALIARSGNIFVGMCLFNTGDSDVTSVECSYQLDDNQAVTQIFYENIPSGSFKNLVFDVPANLIPDGYNQIPWLFMDDYECGVNAPTQALFDEHFDEAATMQIGGSFYTDGDYYCVQVQTVYPNDIVSVKAVATTNEYWTIGEVDDVLHVETFPETSPETSQISLMTIQGKIIKKIVLNNNQIYVGDLPNGVYFVEIKENNGARKVARVIINHK